MILTLKDLFSSDAIWTHRRNGMINLKPLNGCDVKNIYSNQKLVNTGREIMFDVKLDNYSFNFTANKLPYGNEAPVLGER